MLFDTVGARFEEPKVLVGQRQHRRFRRRGGSGRVTYSFVLRSASDF
jgi:hypothetical protein